MPTEQNSMCLLIYPYPSLTQELDTCEAAILDFGSDEDKRLYEAELRVVKSRYFALKSVRGEQKNAEENL